MAELLDAEGHRNFQKNIEIIKSSLHRLRNVAIICVQENLSSFLEEYYKSFYKICASQIHSYFEELFLDYEIPR